MKTEGFIEKIGKEDQQISKILDVVHDKDDLFIEYEAGDEEERKYKETLLEKSFSQLMVQNRQLPSRRLYNTESQTSLQTLQSGSLKQLQFGSLTPSQSGSQSPSLSGSLQGSQSGSLRPSLLGLKSPPLSGQQKGSQQGSLKRQQLGSLKRQQLGTLEEYQSGSLKRQQLGTLEEYQSGSLKSNQSESLKTNQSGSLRPSQSGLLNLFQFTTSPSSKSFGILSNQQNTDQTDSLTQFSPPLISASEYVQEQQKMLMKYATDASLTSIIESERQVQQIEGEDTIKKVDFGGHDPISLYRKHQKQVKIKRQVRNTIVFQNASVQDGKPRFVKWVKNKKPINISQTQNALEEIKEDNTESILSSSDSEYIPDNQLEEEEITSVILVEMRLIPIFPNKFGILPSIKITKKMNARELLRLERKQGYELDEEALELYVDDIKDISDKEKIERKRQIEQQRVLLLKSEEKRVKQKTRIEIEDQIRNELRFQKLPQRVIVRTRTTDAKSEMLETQPASFTVEADIQTPGKLVRDATRGYFFEELDMVTDERSPIIVSLIGQEDPNQDQQKYQAASPFEGIKTTAIFKDKQELQDQSPNKLNQQHQLGGFDINQYFNPYIGSTSKYFKEIALTTFAIPVIEAAQRQGEIYLVRFVDEQRGYAVSVGICVHHMKMVRRLFESPKIGMMMQLYLSPIHQGHVPYPPVIVSRITGNSLADWNSLTDEVDNNKEQIKKMEEINVNIIIDGQIELSRTNIQGYSRKSLPFTCVPIVKRPIRRNNLRNKVNNK
ncbi:MAG: hypothetical protein EZS28_004685 [Streblomastix strix]|uniref:Uncharacterized protein n=1 Tax=Streblomastix strix TaxID=222440 RepID=A0A5J4WZL1_9EUKA|nr:MAG: hypothetical protein EZS28_004685 [Streblomastix strix]